MFRDVPELRAVAGLHRGAEENQHHHVLVRSGSHRAGAARNRAGPHRDPPRLVRTHCTTRPVELSLEQGLQEGLMLILDLIVFTQGYTHTHTVELHRTDYDFNTKNVQIITFIGGLKSFTPRTDSPYMENKHI